MPHWWVLLHERLCRAGCSRRCAIVRPRLAGSDLELALRDYGPAGASADPRHALFSQPEVVVFLERLEHARIALLREWRAAELPEQMLEATSAVWGVSVDTD